MNDKIDKKVYVVAPLKKICMTIGELPTSYLETMSYYEMLVWFINYLRDTLIPTINNNAEAIAEIQELFIKLQNYVNDYFNNLDLTEIVEEKLYEMVINGKITLDLQDIYDEETKELTLTIIGNEGDNNE